MVTLENGSKQDHSVRAVPLPLRSMDEETFAWCLFQEADADESVGDLEKLHGV